MKKNIVILDTDSIAHKCYKAADPIFDKNGKDQRVLFGIINNLVNMCYYINADIDELYVVFDPENGSDYRRKYYPQYKLNRSPHEEDFIRQKKDAIKALRYVYGLLVYDYPSYEADDTIGSIIKVKSQLEPNSKIWLFSPDKDMSQLVNEQVIQYKKNKLNYEKITVEEVKRIYGLSPSQIPDWLALMGDSVDNILGIEKIGAVTASKLLNTYKSIEHLIAFAHEMPVKTAKERFIKEQIILNKENLKLYKKLATIKQDIDLNEYNSRVETIAINVQKDNFKYNERLFSFQKYCNFPNKVIEPFIKE